jgi:hypothetical protein
MEILSSSRSKDLTKLTRGFISMARLIADLSAR